MSASSFDYILVGGGLQSGLLVLALRHYQPTAKVLLVERDCQLGGNHTWSFHPKDVSPSAIEWISPAVEVRWPSYRVRVGGFEKQIELEYASISTPHFIKTVEESLDGFGSNPQGVLLLRTDVTEIGERHIATSCGDSYHGRLVIDCRGPKSVLERPFSQNGHQKFWGFEIALQSDWPFPGPVVMDDRIDQSDGFRFIYSLPFDRRRVLVEDTRFANGSDIDREDCLQQVSSYLQAIGVENWSIIREEQGILPMPFSGERLPGTNANTSERVHQSVLAGGYAGGWFHAATGYSFPLAIAFAETVARNTPETAMDAVRHLGAAHRSRSRFGRFLNRLLFCLVKPTKRYQIFRRFYKVLSKEAIARFYSHQFTIGDAFRIVVGMPPAGLQPSVFLRSFVPGQKKVESASSRQLQVLESPTQVLQSSCEEIGV